MVDDLFPSRASQPRLDITLTAPVVKINHQSPVIAVCPECGKVCENAAIVSKFGAKEKQSARQQQTGELKPRSAEKEADWTAFYGEPGNRFVICKTDKAVHFRAGRHHRIAWIRSK